MKRLLLAATALASLGAAHAQTVSISGPAQVPYGIAAWMRPYGTLQISPEIIAQLADPFPGSSFDANKWTAGGGTAPTVSSGQVVLSLGTSNSLTSTLVSVPTFAPTYGFTVFGAVVGLESAQLTNPLAYRTWGLEQVNSFAYATPVTNGPAFEVDSTGALNAVFWAVGTRYVVASTNPSLITAQGSLPSGVSSTTSTLTWKGGPHTYLVMWRADEIFWFVDNLQVPVATLLNAHINTASITASFTNATTTSGTVLATTFTVNETGVSDTANPITQISDGTYAFRKAKVDTYGNLPVGPYPLSATPVTGNATGSTGSVVGTLAAASSKTTYICGFDVSAIGGTAAVGPITVAGLTGSSMVYQLSSLAAGVTFSHTFTPCIPASAVNTAITVTTTADGTATAVDVNSWGFQQ
jgi:hypothetical protein